MDLRDPKDVLSGYLAEGHDAVLRKLDGAAATVAALDLDAIGHVPWWPAERSEVTLHRILVHMIAETHRHAGHADILRESVDGRVGLRGDDDNVGTTDPDDRRAHHDRVEALAQRFR